MRTEDLLKVVVLTNNLLRESPLVFENRDELENPFDSRKLLLLVNIRDLDMAVLLVISSDFVIRLEPDGPLDLESGRDIEKVFELEKILD
jgi:hypothetical protein